MLSETITMKPLYSEKISSKEWEKLSPKAISIEGIDGAGKTTLARFIAKFLKEKLKLEVNIFHEPDATPLGKSLKNILALENEHNHQHNPWTEALLFLACRVENLHKNIIPSLKTGKWVILDRFHDSTLAYQGYGQKLNIDSLNTVYNVLTGGFTPNWTLLIDCPAETSIDRIIAMRGTTKQSRWEKKGIEFLTQVRKGFLELAAKYPDRFTIIDGTKSKNEVIEEVKTHLQNKISHWAKNELTTDLPWKAT